MPRKGTKKAQSAMEYLMTYGWAILILAIVLGVLYQLGVFTSTSFVTKACLAEPGYTCQTPILTTGGSLSATIGQVSSQTITITELGCSSDTQEPTLTTLATPIVLPSGSLNTTTFTCPLSNAQLGTSFSGYLWIGYTTPTQQTAVVSQIATITVSATGYGSAQAAAPLAYIPITLTNSQSSPTATGFQQLIDIGQSNCAGCGAYETGSLSNIEFTTAPNGGGQVLDSWVESNPSNTASSTDVWVKLSSAIAASGTQTIYLNFLASNTLSASGPNGQAPTLTSQYAEYDDGAEVFNLYDNFYGDTLNSQWVASYGGSSSIYTVDNGLTITTDSSPSWSGTIITTQSTFNPESTVFEAYMTGGGSGETGIIVSNAQPPNNADGAGAMGLGNTGGYDYSYYAWGPGYLMQGGLDNNRNSFVFGSGPGSGVLSLEWPDTGTEIGMINYGSTIVGYDANATDGPSYYGIGIQWNGGDTSSSWQWTRVRDYPPSGVMPGYLFGSLTTG